MYICDYIHVHCIHNYTMYLTKMYGLSKLMSYDYSKGCLVYPVAVYHKANWNLYTSFGATLVMTTENFDG